MAFRMVHKKGEVVRIITNLLFNMFFGFVNTLITFIGNFVTIGSTTAIAITQVFLNFLGYAVFLFGKDTFKIIIANIAVWMYIFTPVALIKWIVNKIPTIQW